ncbi:MAG: tetratricopeptide repeat protein [Phycisphaerae bacterium]|nr:tetratricopeptide repeat protein [Phycisphaerae bacterium]
MLRPETAPKRGKKPVARGRLWLFRLLALTLVPTALLGSVEIILRLSGYGFTPHAMVKDDIQGQTVYRDNPQFGWLFFPWKIARESSPYRFPGEKGDNVYRIFILGESAAQGTPDPAFAFGRILQVMLADHYPDVEFQVINTAMVATNSHVVRHIARDCARHKPDLFIVYLGNNEVVGPFGAGTVFSPLTGNLTLIRLGIALKATRTGQLLSNLADRLPGRSDAPAVWTGMDMFLEKQVRAEDRSLQTVYGHFRKNVEDICDIASNAGAELILSTVATNLRDNPPFASLHHNGISTENLAQWQRLYDEGVAMETQARFQDAIDTYLAAVQIDDTYADLHFRLATCYDQLSNVLKANAHYVRARDLDTLRFRADSRINEIICHIAEHRSGAIDLVDAAGALAAKSPGGIIGKELLHEHVHLNFTGNYLIAQQLFDRVSALLPEARARRRIADSPIQTEQQCRDALTYTLSNEHANVAEVLNDFIKKPPFTGQLYHERRVAELEKKEQTLRAQLTPDTLKRIDQQYQLAVASRKADWWVRWKYADFLSEQMRNERSASAQYLWVKNFVPHYAQAWAKLGTSLGKQGNLDAAVAMNSHALELNPAHVFARYNLAFACQMRGQYDKALEHYRLAIQYKPDYPEAYNNIGAILYQQGHVEEAVTTYRNALEQIKDYADLYYNLGVILEHKGLIDEAIEQYRAALNVEPDSPKLRKALDIASAKRK